MSVEDLRKRYLWIAKHGLSFLKDHGFKKKGQKYIKQEGEIIYKIYPFIAKAYLNTEFDYDFDIAWEIRNSNSKFLETLKCIWGYTDLEEALLIYGEIGSVTERRQTGITNKDPIDYDQQYVDGIIHKIRTSVFQIFDEINSLDNVIHRAEEEAKLEKNERRYFPYNVYEILADLYTYKGRKDKALEMCDKDIEETPATARHLAEEDKKKYIKYFDQLKGI